MTSPSVATLVSVSGLALLAACGPDPTPAAPADSVVVTPATAGVLVGETLQLTARVYDAAGHELVDRPVTWTSSAPTQAAVSSAGLVTGLVLSDSVAIAATSEGKRASATITVVMDIAGEWNFTEQIEVWWFLVGNPNQGVGTVAASCSDTGSFQFTQGGTQISGTMSHVGTCLGHPSPDVPLGSWDNTVRSIPIANVQLSGTHLGFGVGEDGCSYQGDVTGPPTPKVAGTFACPFSGRIWLKGTWEAAPGGQPVASLAVRSNAQTVVGGAAQLVGVPRDVAGHVLSRVVTWASDMPSVATVSTTGLVSTLAPGSTRITGASETKTGSATVGADLVAFRSVSAGGHGCAIRTGGSAYCWGFGGNGELGTGLRSLGDEALASAQTPRAVAGGHSFAQVSASVRHSCGVTPAHQAYCWGENSQGQLGDGSTTSSLVPVVVTGGHSFSSVTAGYYHTCGLTTVGQVYCWGNNLVGQLGAPGSPASGPVRVGGDTLIFQSVRAGVYHTCGITPTHDAYCWGYNDYGQVGNGTTSRSVGSPVQVAGGHSFSAVGAGFAHSCGVTSDGTGYCWGAGSLLGDGSFDGVSPMPRAVTGGPFATGDSVLGVGQEHSCALTAAGAALCWGHNSLGELGDGSTIDRTAPVPVSGGLSFGAISVGHFFACGLTTDAVAVCWGDNADGRLGAFASQSCLVDGTTYPCATAPVPVIGQSAPVGIVAARSLQVDAKLHRARQPLHVRGWRQRGFAGVVPSVPATTP